MNNNITFSRQKATILCASSVVGTIHSPGALDAALRLQKGAVDFLELRVDAFAMERTSLARLEEAAGLLCAPLIVTVRHPKEGGSGNLPLAVRRMLFGQFLSCASLIDVELRCESQFSELISEARERGIGVILSHHDFQRTPRLERLKELAAQAAAASCSVFKLATVTNTAKDLSVLLDFLANRPKQPTKPQQPSGSNQAFSVMGMGEFGKISRLVLARAGSVLNYGYLDQPQVPGQWSAELLKKRLLELNEHA